MYTRIAIAIVLFNVFLSAGAGAMQAAGLDRTHGLDPSPGGDTSDAQTAAEKADNPGGAGLGTLFGLRYFMGGLISSIVNSIPAAAAMKTFLPGFFVDYLYAGQTIFVGVAIISFFRTGGGT